MVPSLLGQIKPYLWIKILSFEFTAIFRDLFYDLPRHLVALISLEVISRHPPRPLSGGARVRQRVIRKWFRQAYVTWATAQRHKGAPCQAIGFPSASASLSWRALRSRAILSSRCLVSASLICLTARVVLSIVVSDLDCAVVKPLKFVFLAMALVSFKYFRDRAG